MLLQQFTALLGRHSGKSFFPNFSQKPSVFKFFPDRALKEAMPFYQLYKRPVRKKFRSKVFGKGFGGNSPWDGEMSEGQGGHAAVSGTFPQKGFPR